MNTGRNYLATAALLISVLIFGCATPEKAAEPGKETQAAVPEEKAPAAGYETVERLIREGDSGGAAAEFDRIRNEDAESVIAYAGLLMSSGDYSGAEDQLLSLLEKEPDNADALFNMSLVSTMKGDEKKGLEYLQKAVEADPGHSNALALLGVNELSEGRFKKAASLFEKALENDAENVMALTGYGSTLIRQEDYEKAEEYLDRAVELDPGNAFTYLDRSSARAAVGNMKGAESDLSAAIEIQPDYFWHYLDRGRLRVRDLGDADGALEDFNRAIELNPDIFYTYVYRAGIYDETGELEAAAADYRRVTEMKPDYYFAYSSLGVIYFLLEDWDASRTAFEKAFDYEPGEFAYPAMACVTVLKSGDRNEIKKYVKKTMDEIPVKNIYYQILRAYIETGYDAYALRLIQEEEDETLRIRLLFYIAELYQHSGMETAAYSYFNLCSEKEAAGLWESRIAADEIDKYYE